MTYVNNGLSGQDMAPADVCKTPAPPLPFIPVPYPNMGMRSTAIPTQFTVMILAQPMHTIATMVPTTLGDQAGSLGGVASSTFMGPSQHSKGSLAMFCSGQPVTRLSDPTMQNTNNAPGMTVAPGQTMVQVAL